MAFGIIAPKPKCRHCHVIINLEAEIGGKLRLVNGYPVCTPCRLLDMPKAGKIDYKKVARRTNERKRFLQDVQARQAFIKKKEEARIWEVAAASQEKAERLDPKTRFHK